jgi:dTDP-glucose 4,6-dehydratase
MTRVLVTGGAGFIGSHVCDALLRRGDEVLCLDNMTYAGSSENVARLQSHDRFAFTKGDISDPHVAAEAVAKADAIINCAAETHVDRSLLTPARFAHTDAYGLAVLLEVARASSVRRIVHLSTDEVYGPALDGEYDESAPLRPTSPYAASKAGGDLIAQAFAHTYRMDIRVTRGCNAYGPWQHPEKFIPLMVTNALRDEALPVYGDGAQQREWCHVEDHASAILTVLDQKAPGIYNIGSGERLPNLEVIGQILSLTGRDASAIEHVTDRPGHDRRYAIDARRLRSLGWKPRWRFPEGLAATVQWYKEHEPWWGALRDASREYFEQMYVRRDASLEQLTRPAAM